MIHPSTEVRFIDDVKGYGLVATDRIPCGTITWTLDAIDRVISPQEMAAYEERFRDILLKYSFRDKHGNYVFCWDNGRFINHSFFSNCCLTPYDFEIAIRDIEPGEELTDDYGYLNIIEPFAADTEGGERRIVYPDDLLTFADMWDGKIRMAFPKIPSLDQPLWQYLPTKTVKAVTAILQGEAEISSLRSCHYPGARR